MKKLLFYLFITIVLAGESCQKPGVGGNSTIEGYVFRYDSITGNRVYLANKYVYISIKSTNPVDNFESAKTGADGHYSFNKLTNPNSILDNSNCTYYVVCADTIATANGKLIYTGADNFTTNGSEFNHTINIPLTTGNTKNISLNIRYKDPYSGNTLPLPNASLLAISDNNLKYKGLTDNNGNATLFNVAADRIQPYSLRITASIGSGSTQLNFDTTFTNENYNMVNAVNHIIIPNSFQGTINQAVQITDQNTIPLSGLNIIVYQDKKTLDDDIVANSFVHGITTESTNKNGISFLRNLRPFTNYLAHFQGITIAANNDILFTTRQTGDNTIISLKVITGATQTYVFQVNYNDPVSGTIKPLPAALVTIYGATPSATVAAYGPSLYTFNAITSATGQATIQNVFTAVKDSIRASVAGLNGSTLYLKYGSTLYGSNTSGIIYLNPPPLGPDQALFKFQINYNEPSTGLIMPLPNALISIHFNNTTYTGTTDQNGKVSISAPSASTTYDVSASLLSGFNFSNPGNILSKTSNYLVLDPTPLSANTHNIKIPVLLGTTPQVGHQFYIYDNPGNLNADTLAKTIDFANAFQKGKTNMLGNLYAINILPGTYYIYFPNLIGLVKNYSIVIDAKGNTIPAIDILK